MFSSITSPTFSELVIPLSLATQWEDLSEEVTFFETLRKMNQVRPFKLVFLFEDAGSHREETRQELVDALDTVIAQGLLDFLDAPPTVKPGGVGMYNVALA